MTVKRMRRQITQILPVELAQGPDKRRRAAHCVAGKAIGLVLVLARPATGQWREPEGGQTTEHTEEQKDRNDLSDSFTAEGKSFNKPSCSSQPAKQSKHRKRTHGRERDHFGNMAQFVVTDLMREHRFQFLRLHLFNQGIKKHDAPKPAKTRKEGI